MDPHTTEAKKWLDERYRRHLDGHYFAHQPLYGIGSNQSEPNPVMRLARTYHIFRILDYLKFGSFLDVGGGEGYNSGIIRRLYGVDTVSADLSSEACQRAREIFGVQSVSCDASVLPFKDKSFDLVLCSEVIEHLFRPAMAISELVRLARKYVVITTAEFSPTGEFERRQRVAELNSNYPHAERNWYTHRDFKTLLGDAVIFHSQMDNLGGRAVDYFANTSLSLEQVQKALDYLTRSSAQDPSHDGVIVIAPQDRGLDLAEFESAYQENANRTKLLEILLTPIPVSQASSPEGLAVTPALVDSLMCLRCGGGCMLADQQIKCKRCGTAYPLENSVPVMLANGTDAPIEVHTEEYAIRNFSNGNPQRAAQVRSLIARLHGARPVSASPWRKKLAAQALRLLWLVKRPETFRTKTRRVLHKLHVGRYDEFEGIKQAIG